MQFRSSYLPGFVCSTALSAMVAICLVPQKAQAQFVCGGSTNGGETQAGGSSSAAANSVACGVNVNASGPNSYGAGVSTDATNPITASGTRSVAVGTGDSFFGTTAKGLESVAIGYGAFAGGTDGIAIGSVAIAGNGANNIAIGGGINPGFSNTEVIGGIANGNNSVIIGPNSGGGGTANNAVALGQGAKVGADNTTAVGQGSNAAFAGSAAFGQGATTTRANQQMFGTSSNSYTMAGLTTTSTAAQTGPLQIVTSDSSGTLGTNTAAGLGLATTSQINTINSQLGLLSSRIDDVNASARRGIAATAAMAYAPTPSRPGATTFAINGSAYENTGGVGVAFEHRFANTRVPVYFSGAYGNGGGREHVGRVGLAFELP